MITLQLVRSRTTKRTVIYEATEPGAAVTQLYVEKPSAKELGDPAQLVVVLAEPSELAES